MSSVYLYSKRDIANVIRDLAQNLVDNMNDVGAEWYQQQGLSVSAQALQIWLDRLNNYPAYEKSVREDAAALGAVVRMAYDVHS